jgi:hypothetical protein
MSVIMCHMSDSFGTDSEQYRTNDFRPGRRKSEMMELRISQTIIQQSDGAQRAEVCEDHGGPTFTTAPHYNCNLKDEMWDMMFEMVTNIEL